MKKIVALLVALMLVGCGKNPNSPEELQKYRTAYSINDTHDRVESLVYVKDAKTGLCFGSSSGAMSNGGPILVNVPCDTVAQYLKPRTAPRKAGNF